MLEQLVSVRKFIVSTLVFQLFLSFSVCAQEHQSVQPNPKYTIYGFIRNDMFVNSRQSREALGGLFSLYPLDKSMDGEGKDANAVINGAMLSTNTRIGFQGGNIALGETKAGFVVEADFCASLSGTPVFRLRQAYASLLFKESHRLIVGQTWHPFYSEAMTLSFNAGTPFQPFGRMPQLRYDYLIKNWEISAAMVTPVSKFFIPELLAKAQYSNANWIAGAGFSYRNSRFEYNFGTSDAPIMRNYGLNSLSGTLFATYHNKMFKVTGKATVTQNGTHLTAAGGSGVVSVDSINRHVEYTNLNKFTSLVTASYGKKWRVTALAGYGRDLGSNKPIQSISGVGADVMELLRGSSSISFNKNNLTVGFELEATSARYGEIKSGILTPKDYYVTNIRGLLHFCYRFSKDL